MKKLGIMFIILTTAILTGCQKDLPKPETKPKIFNGITIHPIMRHSVAASKQVNEEGPSIFVRHRTQGQNVFVECIVTGVSFRETDQSQQRTGKMIVWIDGDKRQVVSQAAFIIKRLPPGNHLIKLEVVNLQNKPYGIHKEFKVNITKEKQNFTSSSHSW